MKTKKGMIGNIVDNISTGAIGLLVLAGIMVGVASFGSSQVTGVAGCNSTVTSGCGAAYNLTTNIAGLSNNFGTQLPTVGTMFGVALILGAIGLIGYGIAVGSKKMQE
jgi:hypothetical protein